MINITLARLRLICDGLEFCDSCQSHKFLVGLTWDSRQIQAHNIFVAMPGQKSDGNNFIEDAILKGAGAVIATKKPNEQTLDLANEFLCPIIVVNRDILSVLEDLAAYWRQQLDAVVIGITGSSGKTSTKEYLMSILEQSNRVCGTAENKNNEYGVVQTVLNASKDCEYLIVELGMRGLGQIEHLCSYVKPNIGIITNIGSSHLELLGTRQNIALAKTELALNLCDSGAVFLNADNDMTAFSIETILNAGKDTNIFTFGLNNLDNFELNASWENVVINDDATCTFDLNFNLDSSKTHINNIKLGIAGKHNLYNSCSCALCAKYLGVSLEDIKSGIENTSNTSLRMQIDKALSGCVIVNDSYNANPDSMKASLDTFYQMKCEGKKFVCLGDMGELGENEDQLHYQVGAHFASLPFDYLICIGPLAKNYALAAIDAGYDKNRIFQFDDKIDVCKFLKKNLRFNDLLLLKASRFMQLETISLSLQGQIED
ncbi:MAG: UDP-N-acetylmuramoyl-tripeptide--D-alanyl-D-alanine ligase [Coriobacteriales bacterium]|nr:UDP-N-acetylmuramoyl-tripeptide--D-alanyl-D-alanine ligase [Coriobacteriales bacterium]